MKIRFLLWHFEYNLCTGSQKFIDTKKSLFHLYISLQMPSTFLFPLHVRNYVVQHVLDERIQHATIGILEKLKGYFVSLSMNKFGSNVVEKCLIWSGEENASMIIEEFMHSPYFVNICRNNFGNYVVQKALEVSKVRTFRLCLLIYWLLCVWHYTC